MVKLVNSIREDLTGINAGGIVMKKDLLVIVVTYNAMKWAEKCFESLRHSNAKADVYVIDNGSTDDTQDYIKKYYPEVIFYQNKENIGFGKANNIGLQYALDHNYDYVYLLNQDAWIRPDTIDELIRFHNENPSYGILSPFQLQANMSHLDRNFASNVCSYVSNPYILEDAYFNRMSGVYEVSGVMAAHWLISRECIERVGGFSPTFPHYGEDDNYANRALFHGFKIGIVPNAIAIHDRESRKETKERKIYMGYIGCLINLSTIYNKVPYLPIKIIKNMFCQMFVYHSLKPIGYLFRVMWEIPRIIRNRERSKAKQAFLI